ncbi:MAG: RsmB/NOP family class I SAM-dependent RNA methyltransferase [Treponema sp.]|nr:RsmB/NOP family class I SAM-dependent RNA methyltransferase [Treponema sp.]
MKKNEKLRGAEGFDSYYHELYGDRWESLRNSLFSDGAYVKLDFSGSQPYFLDPASVCAALCLPVRESSKVLDLCAAPGGKTLVLAGNLSEKAVLYSNERSAERKMRLSKVISQTLPEVLSKGIVVSCSDGATWCRRETEAYDSILLDAPCSSERHVLLDEKYLREWSPSRTKQLSIEQWALLSSAWRLLVKGGYMVYSTCALSVKENDDVISRLLKKFDDVRIASYEEVISCFSTNRNTFAGIIEEKEGIEVMSVLKNAEKTKFGLHILPDSSCGAGPIFFSLIQKINT